MLATLRHTLLFAVLPFTVLGSLSKRATPSSWELYAYGTGHGGLSVFYSDGLAYAGDPTLANGSDVAEVVTFSVGADNMWIGNPNTTFSNSTDTPDWANVTLYVPGPSDDNMQLGFLNSNDTISNTTKTSGFSFYGQTAMYIEEDGTVETLFTALKLDSGVLQLYWNDTSSGQTPVTLRRTAPSNPTNRRAPPNRR
ncbi:hypothetical protein P280DRAFT_467837 [Massarina eburnea CBS 473.64]|uniref:Concanavalin A-like lectin/glucanase n=1 Tax=Massarina eburnea CBS 473.64 TaxID=1395130 RepID=A0A6A6S8H9_9PLEO|nr:hypothetical protein P280DRAFT_467837 [Massarina eburnea CBS 473.64]